MFLVFPLKRIELAALWVLCFILEPDVFQTFWTHGAMGEEGGVNFVAHGIGFLCGLLGGIVARLSGVMHRYDALSGGHALLGYWPETLSGARLRRRRACSRRRLRAHPAGGAEGAQPEPPLSADQRPAIAVLTYQSRRGNDILPWYGCARGRRGFEMRKQFPVPPIAIVTQRGGALHGTDELYQNGR